jgi:hypothetical protein
MDLSYVSAVAWIRLWRVCISLIEPLALPALDLPSRRLLYEQGSPWVRYGIVLS